MSQGCASTLRNAAARRSVVLGLALCLSVITTACGPQTVPYPIGARPPQSNQPILPPPTTSTAGSRANIAGRAAPPPTTTPSRAGAGSVTTGPVAGSGVIVMPGGALAAQGGNVAPPPRAGSAPVPEAGSDAPSTPTTEPGTAVPFEPGTDPARNQVQPGMLCARIAAIQCAGEQHCCTTPAASVSSCQSSLASACANMLYLDMIAANPVTGFDAEATTLFLDELEQRSATCDVTIGSWFISPEGLRGILKGTIGPDQSCKPPGADLNNRPVMAAALGSCLNLATHACLPRSLLGNWTCAAKGGIGSGCATDDNCQGDMYCRQPDPLGECAARLPVGASCMDGGTECSSLYCRNGRCVEPSSDVAFCLE